MSSFSPFNPLSPLALALQAMTALQAVVAMGCLSLSVLAPQLGLGVTDLALLNTVLSTTGAVTALLAGRLLAGLGDWRLAAACSGAGSARPRQTPCRCWGCLGC